MAKEDFTERSDAMNILEQLDEADKAAPAIPAQPEKPTEMPCNRCGHDTNAVILKPTDAEREVYIKGILSGKPFEKKFELFGGMLTMHFRTLTNSQADGLGVILKGLTETDPVARATQAMKIKILYYLVGYNKETYTFPDLEDFKQAEELVSQRFDDMSEDVMSIIIRTYQEFYTLISTLSTSGFDESFYKGAGLA